MNTLDIFVVATIALSGLFAFVRGFVREALSIAAWIGAAVATYYGYALALPYTSELITSVLLAQVVTVAGLFIGSLILLSFLTSIVSSQVRESSLGALDRALGLLFGVVRGAALVCLAYLAMTHFLTEDNRPGWVAEAKSLPLLAAGASQLQQFLPHSEPGKGKDKDEKGNPVTRQAGEQIHALSNAGAAIGTAGQALRAADDAISQLTQPRIKEPPKPPTPPGTYRSDQQQELNRLFQATEGPK